MKSSIFKPNLWLLSFVISLMPNMPLPNIVNFSSFTTTDRPKLVLFSQTILAQTNPSFPKIHNGAYRATNYPENVLSVWNNGYCNENLATGVKKCGSISELKLIKYGGTTVIQDTYNIYFCSHTAITRKLPGKCTVNGWDPPVDNWVR